MGKATELKTTTDLVKDILEKVPETRNNDNLLYYRVCEKLNHVVLGLSFGMVLINQKEFNLPSIETVGRARRKVQEKYAHLRASDNVEAGRMLAEEVFREYAKESV